MLKASADFDKYRISESISKVLLTTKDQDSYTITRMELHDWVKAARKHRKWTQQQLGDAVGRSKANVAMWENGSHKPSYEQIVQIARQTGFPMPEQLPQNHEALTMDYSLGGRGGNIVGLPVVGTIQFGKGHCQIDEIEDGGTVLGSGIQDGYALRVKGSGLEPILKDGQLLVLEQEAHPAFSEYCVLGRYDQDDLVFAEYLAGKVDGTLTFEVVETHERLTVDRNDLSRLDGVIAVVSPRQWRPAEKKP